MKLQMAGAVVLLGLAMWVAGCESNPRPASWQNLPPSDAIGRNPDGTLEGAGIGARTGYTIGSEEDKAETRAAQQEAALESPIYVVDVKNSDGSITPVALTRSGDVWTGPQGEKYYTLPTEGQLRQMYGN